MITPSAYRGGPLLILDGDLPSANTLHSLLSRHAPTVAADGAARKLRAYGICPDVIIGDFDTLGEERNHPFYASATIIEEKSQNSYDGEKSLVWIVGANYDRVTVLGAGGGMLDHVLNNFSLFARFSERLNIALHHQNAVGYIVRTEMQLETCPGDRISLIPLPEARLTTEGLKWNLNDGILKVGVKEGASNRAVKRAVRIEITEGRIVCFHFGEGDKERVFPAI